jgi:ferredoxin
MSDRPALPFRIVQRGLRAASRASERAVDRLMRVGLADAPARISRPPRARAEPGPIVVRVGGSTARVQAGSTVLEAAVEAGVDLRHYCGGNCSCGTCRVEIVAGRSALSRPEPMEAIVLGPEALDRGDRLACQAQVHGDVEVRVPGWF